MKKKYLTVSISFSPDPPLLDYAKAEAQREDRTLSKWVCRLIAAHREQQRTLNTPVPNPQLELAVGRKVTYGRGGSSSLLHDADAEKALGGAAAAKQLAQESAPKRKAAGPSANKPAPGDGAGKGHK